MAIGLGCVLNGLEPARKGGRRFSRLHARRRPSLETRLQFEIQAQPNDTACGPTCLHAVYRYHGDAVELEEVMAQTAMLEGGGTLAVLLGNHALGRGYRARIYTYNLEVFDPTWFPGGRKELGERLRAQAEHKKGNKRLQRATKAYLEFLEAGGRIYFEELTARLIRRFLKQSVPILTGLSSTYLYQEARELPDSSPDDLRGEPQGHFVVLCGYNKTERTVLVADPLTPNPIGEDRIYELPIERVITSILLGILTYDANLLVVEPGTPRQAGRINGHSVRRR